MTKITVLMLVAMLVSNCRGRWVEDAVIPACVGGRVNVEKRITDVTVTGRTRNTVIRTDACLD